MSDIVTTLVIVTRNESDAVKAAEVVGRAATGLALDGINTSIEITPVPKKKGEE